MIDPWLGNQMPYVTFFIAVAVTGMYAGVAPALLATMVGAAVGYWCFVPPRYQWGFQGVSDAVGFAVYLAVAIAIVLLTRARNKAAEEAERSLKEQIETQRELVDAQTLFRSFMENSPGCAYLVDERGLYSYMNASAEKLIKARGGTSDYASADAHNAHQLDQQDEEVLRSGHSLQYVDKVVDPDSERYWLTTKFPFVDQRGRRFVGGHSFDITDRVRAEEVLRQAERLAAAGRMASLLAHEINNPLAAVTNALFLLDKQPLPPAAVAYLSLASSELQRVNRVAALTLAFHDESEAPAHIDICKMMDEVARATCDGDLPRGRSNPRIPGQSSACRI